MEYLNNLLNSNTQSGGVYAVSMHQLNQILQLSSAYFNRFDVNTKQQYIKLFGFTPLSLLKGHSSSKMPQYREKFIFLIYLQFIVLLMMNKTSGMNENDTLKYLSELCKKFNISPDNKICKNIRDALSGSTSTGSTSTGSTSTGSTSTGSTSTGSTSTGSTSPVVKPDAETSPVVETPPDSSTPLTSSITLDNLIFKIFNHTYKTGGDNVKIDDFNKEVVDKFINNELYDNFIKLIIYNIDNLNEDIEKIYEDKNINNDIKNVKIIKLILNFISDESDINIFYDDDKKEFIVLNFDENNVEKINKRIKDNSLEILDEYLLNNEKNTIIEELINKNKMEITDNKFNYYDFEDLIERIKKEEENNHFKGRGGSYNNIDITNTLQDIF